MGEVKKEEKKVSRRDYLKYTGAAIGGLVVGGALGYLAAPPKTEVIEKTVIPTREIPLGNWKIGIELFQTGAAAVWFGEPSRKEAELLIDQINAEGGILGRKITPIFRDEGKTTDDAVREFRKLALEDKVDVIIGIISSGNVLACAPVAEELHQFFITFDASTHRLFWPEGKRYRYVFRSEEGTIMQNIPAALLIKKYYPNIKTIAHIDQDYAYGRDSWYVFSLALKKLMPDVEVIYEGWPPLFAGDYTAHISAILAAKPDMVYTSMWGGDASTFLQQAKEMGLFKVTTLIGTALEPSFPALGKDFPEGVIAAPQGAHLPNYPGPQWPLCKKFYEDYWARYGEYVTYPAQHMWQGIMLFKHAAERAAAIVGGFPKIEEIIDAIPGISFPTPSGYGKVREDHEWLETCVFGWTKHWDKPPYVILDPIEAFPPELIQKPVGVTLEDWIASWP
jgi:branched-chain amino acid transport system substrate-binding protein